jgi:putative transposase
MSTQSLTYVCKIRNLDEVVEAIGETGIACSKLWNIALYHSRQVWGETGKVPSAYDTQKAVQEDRWYKRLPAHTAQAVTQELWQAYKSWFGHRRSGNGDANPPKYRKRNGHVLPSTITYKQSAFRLIGKSLRLSRGKAVTEETGQQYLQLDLGLPPNADLSQVQQVRLVPRNGGWQAHLVCRVDVCAEAPGEGVAAVDQGIVNLATVAYSDGTTELYSGRGLLAQEYYFAKELARCKPCAWRPGSRKKKKSKREGRLHYKKSLRTRQCLHTMSRAIIDSCVAKRVGTLVIGDLKGIRHKANGDSVSHGNAGNLKLHAWPFNTFAEMLVYKAKLAGIQVEKIDERNTSCTCSRCGNVDRCARRHRGLYVCPVCNATINADVNGAINILRKYLHGLDDQSGTGVPVREGDPPSIWPEPLVNRYDWRKANPLVRVAGSASAAQACR